MSREVEIVKKIGELYTTSSYISAQFLLSFFSRVYGNDLYLIILSRAISEVVNMIEAIGPEGFSIDPSVVNKAWLKEIGRESIKNKLHKAMLKLLIDQLITPVIISLEVEGLCMKEISP